MEQLLIKLRELLMTTSEIPTPGGTLHKAALAIIGLTTFILILFWRKTDDKNVRKISGVFWVTLLVIESFKQFAAATAIEDGRLVFDYSFGALPFQVCSSIFYILPLVILLPDGKLRDGTIVFISTFSLIGGAAVIIFPDTVFSDIIYTNYQSVIHHSIQVIVGVYLAIRYHKKFTKKSCPISALIFTAMALIALGINEVTHQYFLENDMLWNELNMFFVSPYIRYVPPVLEGFGIESMPFPTYFVSYVALFSLASFIIAAILKAVGAIINPKT